MKETFGSFIAKIRNEKGIGLRELSKRIDISVFYLCNIEKGRRPAPSNKVLYKIANTLGLSEKEAEKMYDLAVESKPNQNLIPKDMKEYIISHQVVYQAIRTARDNGVSDSIWLDFIKKIEEKA